MVKRIIRNIKGRIRGEANIEKLKKWIKSWTKI